MNRTRGVVPLHQGDTASDTAGRFPKAGRLDAKGVLVRALWAGLGAATLALSGCWLQPGFDAGHTFDNPDETQLTSANVAELTEVWEADVGPGALHAPVSYGGAVFVTSSQAAGTVSAIDADTGTILWLEDGLLSGAGSPALAAPVLHDDELLVPAITEVPTPSALGEGHVLRIDRSTGALLGHLGAGDPLRDGHPALDLAHADGQPAVQLVNGGPSVGYVAAWILWKWPANPAIQKPSLFAPGAFAIVGDRLVWSDGTSALGFRDDCQASQSGSCVADWSTDLGALPGQPVAVGDDTVAYPAGGTIHVLDTSTGDISWTADGGDMAVAGDTIFAIDTSSDRLVALPAAGCGAATCQPLWDAPLAGPATRPIVAGDVVYVIAGSGTIQAFPRDGCGTSTCEPLVTIPTGNVLTPTPIVDAGRLIVTTSDGHVMAYGLVT